VFMAAWD